MLPDMNAPNTLTDEETNAGFRLLFDGKTTAGWRGFRATTIDPKWRVTDGALMFHPDPEPQYGHDIVSEEEFSSFELRLEWKLWERGNSGLMYHVVEEAAERPFETGPEMQLLDDANHPDARNGPDRHAGACYGLYAPTDAVLQPLGEWNAVTLLVDGNHVEHHLNGRQVVTYNLGSPDWNARVAASKFAQWPRFARKRRGRICLQDHLDPVAFRNIRIRAW